MIPAQRPPGTSEIDILSRAIGAEESALSASAARSLLAIHFTQADRDRMSYLSEKAREGTLTAEEQVEIDNYERVGHVLNIMQSKARRSLKARRATNGSAKTH